MSKDESVLTWDTLTQVSDQKAQRKLDYLEKKREETIVSEEELDLNSTESALQPESVLRPGDPIPGYPMLRKVAPSNKRRPRMKNILQKMLSYEMDAKSPLTGEMQYCTTGELIIAALVKKGMSGNLKAIELIFDRLEGKAKSAVEISADVNLESHNRTTVNHDLSSLSVDELLTVKDILQKTAIDATIVEAEDNVDDSD